MTRLVAHISLIALLAASACDWRVFDDVEDETWVITRGSPGSLAAADIGQGLSFGGSGGGGLDVVAVGEAPPGLTSLSFERGGSKGSDSLEIRADSPVEFAERYATPPEITSDPANYGSDVGNVAIGAKQGMDSYLLLVKANNMAVSHTITLPQGTLATGIAFGETDRGSSTDLVTVVGPSMTLLEDYQSAPDLVACSLDSSGRDVAIADINPAAGAEIIVGLSTRVAVFSASDITDGTCGDDDALETVSAPAAANEFGDEIAIGDFNGNGSVDIAISATDQNKVHVYLDWNGTAPSEQTIDGPSGSATFGAAMVAGDLDGDGKDELAIGDPRRDAGGKASAGSVFVYANGQFDAPAWTAHDASAKRSQRFGKSVTIALFDDADPVLVVGAKNEVFTYFRTPLYSDVRD